MTIAPTPPTHSRRVLSFKQETIDLVTQLRASLNDATRVFPEGIQKSQDVQKKLGLNFNLSWQIYRLSRSGDPLEVCPHIPAPGPMKKFLTAIKREGAPANSIQAVESAYAAFEKHVTHHAGDRASFDTMITRMIGGDPDAQMELSHRRAFYEGHRYLLGVELDVGISSMILHPSKTTVGGIDMAHLRLKRNLRRLSADTVLDVDKTRLATRTGDEGRHAPIVGVETLDREAFARFGIPILPAFCSTADLPLHQYENREGATVTEWLADSVGRPSAIDVAFGSVYRNYGLITREDSQAGTTLGMTFNGAPVQKFIYDVLVHRSTFGTLVSETSRWRCIYEPPRRLEPLSELGLPQMPCRDQMVYLGSGIASQMSDVPQYIELLKFVCQSQGWALDELDTYRIQIDYPLMHTMTVAAVSFPELKVS